MVKNIRVVKVKKGESPSLAAGEMFLDKENNTLYVGVGTATTDPNEKEEEK